MIYTAYSDRQWLKAIDCICEQCFVSAKWIYVGFMETLLWKAFCDKGRTEIVCVGQQREERFKIMMMSVSDLATTNIYSAYSRHATWTAYISTFTLQIPAILHGQPTFQQLLCRITPCYMDSLHFNIYSAYSEHAIWTAYISTLSLQIPAMLHGQPTFKHLLCIFQPC